MKLLDCLKISFLNINRNKKNIYFILICIICTILILGILTFQLAFFDYLSNTITKNIGFRTLSVSPILSSDDYGKKQLMSIKYVEEVYSAKYDSASVESDFKSKNLDGYIELNYGSKNTLPKNLVGSSFEDDDINVAICPINFYPSSEAFNLIINKNYLINGYNLLNTSFEITYYSHVFDGYKIVKNKPFNKTFKIIGLYNNKDVMTPSNTCYISSRDLQEIKNKEIISDESSAYGFMVVVDTKDHVKYVINELENIGVYGTAPRIQMDTSIINNIQLICNIILSIILFAVIFLTNLYVKKKIKNSNNIIGILRTIGYSKQIINKLQLIEFLLISIFSYLCGVVFFQTFYIILKKTILSSLIYSGFDIKLYYWSYIFSVIIIIIIPSIINIFYVFKFLKLNITDLIRSEE